jgi:hypothetical protein
VLNKVGAASRYGSNSTQNIAAPVLLNIDLPVYYRVRPQQLLLKDIIHCNKFSENPHHIDPGKSNGFEEKLSEKELSFERSHCIK